MERPRNQTSRNFLRNNNKSTSFYSINSDYGKTLDFPIKDNADDFNIQCKIQENTDEITVPLTVCVLIMIR